MNWDAIGAAGEIVGALAVVVSLIYLSGQVKHTNKLARNASTQSVIGSETNFASILLQNACVWNKVISGEQFSDAVEEREGIILFNLYLLDSENRFHQWKDGFLEEQSWKGREKTLDKMVFLPIYELWEKSLSASGHSQDFLHLLSEIRERQGKG